MSVWDAMWYYYFYFSSTDSAAIGIDLGAEDEHRNKENEDFQLLKMFPCNNSENIQ